MTNHTHRQFFDAFLYALNLPVRPAGRRALACVSIFESSQGLNGWNNPLACEQPWPDAILYNDAGVRRYASFHDGVLASAQLYGSPVWTGVRTAFKIHTTRNPILDEFSKVYDGWAKGTDFVAMSFNNTMLLERLDQRLYGPGDEGSF